MLAGLEFFLKKYVRPSTGDIRIQKNGNELLASLTKTADMVLVAQQKLITQKKQFSCHVNDNETDSYMLGSCMSYVKDRTPR